MMQRLGLVFHGRVQNVGFRWKASILAKKYGLTGWVKNEDDGTVSMEIQGEHMVIFVYLMQLKDDDYIRVESMDRRELPVRERDRKFRMLN